MIREHSVNLQEVLLSNACKKLIWELDELFWRVKDIGVKWYEENINFSIESAKEFLWEKIYHQITTCYCEIIGERFEVLYRKTALENNFLVHFKHIIISKTLRRFLIALRSHTPEKTNSSGYFNNKEIWIVENNELSLLLEECGILEVEKSFILHYIQSLQFDNYKRWFEVIKDPYITPSGAEIWFDLIALTEQETNRQIYFGVVAVEDDLFLEREHRYESMERLITVASHDFFIHWSLLKRVSQIDDSRDIGAFFDLLKNKNIVKEDSPYDYETLSLILHHFILWYTELRSLSNPDKKIQDGVFAEFIIPNIERLAQYRDTNNISQDNSVQLSELMHFFISRTWLIKENIPLFSNNTNLHDLFDQDYISAWEAQIIKLLHRVFLDFDTMYGNKIYLTWHRDEIIVINIRDLIKNYSQSIWNKHSLTDNWRILTTSSSALFWKWWWWLSSKLKYTWDTRIGIWIKLRQKTFNSTEGLMRYNDWWFMHQLLFLCSMSHLNLKLELNNVKEVIACIHDFGSHSWEEYQKYIHSKNNMHDFIISSSLSLILFCAKNGKDPELWLIIKNDLLPTIKSIIKNNSNISAAPITSKAFKNQNKVDTYNYIFHYYYKFVTGWGGLTFKSQIDREIKTISTQSWKNRQMQQETVSTLVLLKTL